MNRITPLQDSQNFEVHLALCSGSKLMFRSGFVLRTFGVHVVVFNTISERQSKVLPNLRKIRDCSCLIVALCQGFFTVQT